MTRHELPSQFTIEPPVGAPKPLTAEERIAFDAHLAGAVHDWEIDICDLATLADLTASIAGNLLSTSQPFVTINESQATHILFCIYNLSKRTSALKTDYFAAYEAAHVAKAGIEAAAASAHAAAPAGDLRDAALLAFRPMFEACRANMDAACDAVNLAEQIEGINKKGPISASAYAMQATAVDADVTLSELVASIPARTEEGLKFKRDLRHHWRGCERLELDKSIAADADAMGDDRLYTLGRELDRVHAERLAMDASGEVSEDDCPKYERHWELRTAINEIAATSFDGLRVKACALAYAFSQDEMAECDVAGSAQYLARSLAADVLRIGGDKSELVGAAIAELCKPPRELPA